MPKFHYGTHYSTSGFTLMWLLRIVSADASPFCSGSFWVVRYEQPHFVLELSPALFVKRGEREGSGFILVLFCSSVLLGPRETNLRDEMQGNQ